MAVKRIFDEELSNGRAYQMLEWLATKIGNRLSGSPGAVAAVDWSAATLREFADTVWLQPVQVPHWRRGDAEVANVIMDRGHPLPIVVTALGGSIATGKRGVTGKVIEVKTFDELKGLGRSVVEGNIVFYNRPMDPTLINTFAAYGGAVNQRSSGASEAARLGAIGVVVRSMGAPNERHAHTGAMRYADDAPKIPAVAVSTGDADRLSQILKEDSDVKLFFQTDCEIMEDAQSYNVIADIRGSEKPEEVILVSGHLDSWDVGQGAHDDGAGCVQAMEVLRLFKSMGYKPRHTIRAVLFMNEENGTRGGEEYARQVLLKKEYHVGAIESDRGGFTPRGFTMTASPTVKEFVNSWRPLLESYGLTDFSLSGGGADISFLGAMGVPLFGYLPDSQRYFSYHHSSEDTIDKVNRRELELGAGAMAALVYLIDQNGLPR